jgi:hypothetical protein
MARVNLKDMKIEVLLQAGKMMQFMLLVQTLAQDATRFYDKGCGVAAMALAEAMCIPVDVLPEDPRELYKWAEAYVKYAYGLESQPEWFKDEWLGEDW